MLFDDTGIQDNCVFTSVESRLEFFVACEPELKGNSFSRFSTLTIRATRCERSLGLDDPNKSVK